MPRRSGSVGAPGEQSPGATRPLNSTDSLLELWLHLLALHIEDPVESGTVATAFEMPAGPDGHSEFF